MRVSRPAWYVVNLDKWNLQVLFQWAFQNLPSNSRQKRIAVTVPIQVLHYKCKTRIGQNKLFSIKNVNWKYKSIKSSRIIFLKLQSSWMHILHRHTFSIFFWTTFEANSPLIGIYNKIRSVLQPFRTIMCILCEQTFRFFFWATFQANSFLIGTYINSRVFEQHSE
jgi:hypothetical protein